MNVAQNEHSTLVEYFPCLGKEEEKKENYTFSFGSFLGGEMQIISFVIST